MLTMHVVINDAGAVPTDTVRDIKKLLAMHYGIEHSTIEVEKEACADVA
jgi:Co/Zn/Cd efflux system component